MPEPMISEEQLERFLEDPALLEQFTEQNDAQVEAALRALEAEFELEAQMLLAKQTAKSEKAFRRTPQDVSISPAQAAIMQEIAGNPMPTDVWWMQWRTEVVLLEHMGLVVPLDWSHPQVSTAGGGTVRTLHLTEKGRALLLAWRKQTAGNLKALIDKHLPNQHDQQAHAGDLRKVLSSSENVSEFIRAYYGMPEGYRDRYEEIREGIGEKPEDFLEAAKQLEKEIAADEVSEKPSEKISKPHDKEKPISYTPEEKKLISEYSDWRQSLTEEQAGSIENYLQVEYGIVNEYLRKTTKLSPEERAAAKDLVSDIDHALDSASAPRDLELFRGVKTKEHLKIGEVFKDKAFVSATTRLKVAEEYGAKGGVIVLHVPRGTQGAFVANIGTQNKEFEFLLGRGLSYKVISKRDRGGIPVFEVEVVG